MREPTRDRLISAAGILPWPEWIKVRAPGGATYERVFGLMRSKALHTVCEEARCPNIAEGRGAGTATFLMMGDVCTRSCGFCDLKTGRPTPLDWDEPERVALAIKAMDLKHAVITSINRDEREDGGAPILAMVIRRIREIHPACSVEVRAMAEAADRPQRIEVLVVDDERPTRVLMERELPRGGCSVTCVECGERALEQLLVQGLSSA